MKKLPKRTEIDNKYKWKLEDIYSDEASFEIDFKKTESLIDEMNGLQGNISGAKGLRNCIKLFEEMYCLVDNLFSYSRMRMDEDNSNSKYQVLFGRARELYVKADSASAFMEPLVLSMPEDIVTDSVLDDYRIYLNEILRKKKHTLSAPEEKILAQSAEATGASQEIFSMFNNADLKFPEIKDEEGNMVEMTKGRYIMFMESKNRDVRKAAYEAMYDTYGSYKNMLAASYTSSIKAAKFYSGARGYGSSLEASLDNDNITTDVYDNLVDAINKNLPLMHKYVKIRAKALELEKIDMWDIYVPLVDQDDDKYTFEQACDMVKKGLGVLGDEYVSLLEKGFKEGWIDVYENEGKTSGAYSWGTYLSHPYVLLNYQGTLDNVFTLAHEMGHSMHTYYSNANQPFIYSNYKIFVAEVASTVNEILLLKQMLRETEDKKKRAFLINHFLESFRGTVFRQTMFAEFEKACHGSYTQGKPLSGDDLCSIYYDLNKKYHGDSCDADDRIKYEWSRIPHYYRSFYVYKYATGFSSAVAIAKMIEEEGQPAVERYMNFLKAGDSEYPLEILRKTGVDLSTPEPVEAGMSMFSDLLDEFESLV